LIGFKVYGFILLGDLFVRVGKKACSESFLHCFSYALCLAYGDREASKLISTIVEVFEVFEAYGS